MMIIMIMVTMETGGMRLLLVSMVIQRGSVAERCSAGRPRATHTSDNIEDCGDVGPPGGGCWENRKSSVMNNVPYEVRRRDLFVKDHELEEEGDIDKTQGGGEVSLEYLSLSGCWENRKSSVMNNVPYEVRRRDLFVKDHELEEEGDIDKTQGGGEVSLEYLSLSGCYKITDKGLR